MSAATNGLVFRRLLFVAPAVGATAQALKARYWTPEQHSGFLAMWSLGPGGMPLGRCMSRLGSDRQQLTFHGGERNIKMVH